MNGQDFPLDFLKGPCRRWINSLVKNGDGKCPKVSGGRLGSLEPEVKGGRADQRLTLGMMIIFAFG